MLLDRLLLDKMLRQIEMGTQYVFLSKTLYNFMMAYGQLYTHVMAIG